MCDYSLQFCSKVTSGEHLTQITNLLTDYTSFPFLVILILKKYFAKKVYWTSVYEENVTQTEYFCERFSN